MHRTTTLLIAALALALAAALGGLAARTSATSPAAAAPVSRTYELPRTRVLMIGGATVRLNTETGEVAALRGGGGVEGSGESWRRSVAAVSGNHSGALDIIALNPASFNGVYLIDIDGTRTWLLKWSGNENGRWNEVREIR